LKRLTRETPGRFEIDLSLADDFPVRIIVHVIALPL
jgi:hypothetical protein